MPIEVKAGGASFHQYNISRLRPEHRHGSSARGHLAPDPGGDRFDPVKADPVYSRYRKASDMCMDESYFLVVWSRSGGRSAWLDAELAQDLGSVLAEPGHRS